MSNGFQPLRAGTYEDFINSQLATQKLFKMENAQILIGADRSFILITDQPWIDFLRGHSEVIPGERYDIEKDLSPIFLSSDEEFEKYVAGHVLR